MVRDGPERKYPARSPVTAEGCWTTFPRCPLFLGDRIRADGVPAGRTLAHLAQGGSQARGARVQAVWVQAVWARDVRP